VAVYDIEQRISQTFIMTGYDELGYDHLNRVCMIFVLIFMKFIFTACFDPYTFVVG